MKRTGSSLSVRDIFIVLYGEVNLRLKEDIMKIKNPIRTYLNWHGRNCMEIAAEPAGKALVHYGKFLAQTIAVSFAIYAVTSGVVYAGFKIHDKIEEMKED